MSGALKRFPVMKPWILMLSLWACAAGAATFPPTIELGDTTLTLRGVSLLRVGYIFKVYEAALYVAEGEPTDRALDAVPKALEIRYLRSIAADDLVKAGDDALRTYARPGDPAALVERLAEINTWYVDVRKGDRYTLSFLPGAGSTLALNGAPLGTIPGDDFARDYFAIWLHPDMPYTDFRRGLFATR